jgi:hypothetical protein
MEVHDIAIEEPVRALLRHTVAIIAYRTAICLRHAPAGFADFDAGQEARTPVQLVAHLTALCAFAGFLLVGAPRREVEESAWEGQIAGLEAALAELDGAIQGAARWHLAPEAALQGPLADALTHVGQLALLRRLAGSPVVSESYARAPIRPGELSLA